MKKVIVYVFLTLMSAIVARAQCPATSVTTLTTGSSAWEGITFDVVAVNDLTVDCIDAVFNSGTVDYEVYHKSGTGNGFQTTPGAWTLLSSGSLTGAGNGSTVNVPISPVSVAAGNTEGFAVLALSSGQRIRYNNGGASTLASDANIEIHKGNSVSGRFTGSFGARDFVGTVYYSLIPLPVELLNFEATVVDNEKMELNWQTASEINNAGFEIEYSKDSRNWKQIDFSEGAGSTTEQQNYSYIHREPVSGLNYYRLKQIDFDGAFEYSKTISVEVDGNLKGMSLFPNPGTVGGSINLHISSGDFESGQLTGFDLNGKVVFDQKIESRTSSIDISDMSKGIYYVTLVSDRNRIMEKLIIN